MRRVCVNDWRDDAQTVEVYFVLLLLEGLLENFLQNIDSLLLYELLLEDVVWTYDEIEHDLGKVQDDSAVFLYTLFRFARVKFIDLPLKSLYFRTLEHN